MKQKTACSCRGEEGRAAGADVLNNGGRGNEESPWVAGNDCSFVPVQRSAGEYCRSSPHFYRQEYCGVCGCLLQR
jgi:hypothetical protein